MTARPDAIRLRPVAEIRDMAEAVVARLTAELQRLVPAALVEHIGATSMPDGWTKGDVDVSVRVTGSDFAAAVAAFRHRFEVAQPENWTPTFASFADPSAELALGLQVSVIGSENDFLVKLRDLMRADATVRNSYDEAKRSAAADGPEAYWKAKDQLLRQILT